MTTSTKTTTTKSQTSYTPRAGGARGGSPRPGGSRAPRTERPERVKDVDQKILDIRRVTRVVAGGRRMSFAVSMVIGDKNLGVVGVGTGKGNDTALAIAKALKDAKKNAIKINRTENHSILHDVGAKYCSSKVLLFPNKGKGLVVGAAVREIAIMAGLKDVTGKVISGSKNKLNTARAVMKALATVGTKYVFSAPKVEVTTTEPVEAKK